MSHDVIIAGGGVSGAAAAAAFAQLNWRVLVVEPGLDHTRRLAGELIHPPGVADLGELGLLACLQAAGAVPIHGFAVFAGDTQVLRYDEVAALRNAGLAIEHGTMASALLQAVEKLHGVTVQRGARVTAVDVSSPDHAAVTISHDGRESSHRADLLVAADGRNSHVRRMAGIADKQIQISNMTGFALTGRVLPHPGFGHVFGDGPAPALAYGISATETRIMFDVPAHSSDLKQHVDALPEPLRAAVTQAMEVQTPLRSANYTITPAAVMKGRLVCVGDAGGCCHPVSATGLSACARDAVRLRDSLRETKGDIPAALQLHSRLREAPQRTRMLGADVLYQVMKAATPEMQLLRKGLFRYWEQSPRGRAATMALLSTHDDRVSAVVREYIQVCRHALPGLIYSSTPSRAIAGLPRAMFRVVRGAF